MYTVVFLLLNTNLHQITKQCFQTCLYCICLEGGEVLVVPMYEIHLNYEKYIFGIFQYQCTVVISSAFQYYPVFFPYYPVIYSTHMSKQYSLLYTNINNIQKYLVLHIQYYSALSSIIQYCPVLRSIIQYCIVLLSRILDIQVLCFP